MITISALAEELAEARETIRQLTEPPSGVAWRGISVGPAGRVLLDQLSRSSGPLSQERLRLVLDIALQRREPCSLISVDVAITRLRTQLRKLDPPITITNKWGIGFMLDEENKARLARRRIDPGEKA